MFAFPPTISLAKPSIFSTKSLLSNLCRVFSVVRSYRREDWAEIVVVRVSMRDWLEESWDCREWFRVVS